jgi:HlyD family secretion protein
VLDIDNSKLLLRPGMTATAEIVVEQITDVLQVSNAALRFALPTKKETSSGLDLRKMLQPGPPLGQKSPKKKVRETGKLEIWVLRNQEPVSVLVKTGATDGDRTQIISGDLKVGDPVIVDTISTDS